MAYTALTQKGKNFINSICNGTGNSLLYGKNKTPLPYCYPETPSTTYWTCNVIHNGKKVNSNEELGVALIDWFDKYGKIYEMDANIIAAQAYTESGYFIWNYPPNSTASGISQFTVETVYDVIIMNKYGTTPDFTTDEINLITKNISGNIKDIDTYKVNNQLGKTNRPILHQNIIDNPEIMIKAQYRYMKYLSKKCSKMASSSLFAYNRGPKYAYPSYTKSIDYATNSNNYQNEGIGYVYKIFCLLGKHDYHPKGYFGYDHLGMYETFDQFKAEVDESNLIT